MKGWHLPVWARFAADAIFRGKGDAIAPGGGRYAPYLIWLVFILGHTLGLGVWFLAMLSGPEPDPTQKLFPRSSVALVSRSPKNVVTIRRLQHTGRDRRQAPETWDRKPLAQPTQAVRSTSTKAQRSRHSHPQRTRHLQQSNPNALTSVVPARAPAIQWNSENLQALEQERSRLQAELTTQGQTWLTGLVVQPSDASPVATVDLMGRIQALATLEWQLQAEVLAAQQWQQAIHFAGQASTLGNLSRPTLSTWYQAKAYWQAALTYLRQIPVVSSRWLQVTPKYVEYRHNLDVARYRSELLQSDFLRPIAAQARLSPQTRITVCRLVGECRHYGGNAIVVSPASLIKIPVAIAVLHQLQAQAVSLGTPITVTPSNFTEDAAAIQVGKTYPLQVLLAQMLSHSSNIATNQLIDYFGWETINQALQQEGYRFSRVNFKLMGQVRMPANPGTQANTLNTDELSRMMQQIYRGQSVGHRVAQQALAQQQDRDLGIRALGHRPGDWLGEKTGRTSSTLGTTLALQSRGKTYIVTIVDQTGKADPELRQGIQAIAHYLEQYPF